MSNIFRVPDFTLFIKFWFVEKSMIACMILFRCLWKIISFAYSYTKTDPYIYQIWTQNWTHTFTKTLKFAPILRFVCKNFAKIGFWKKMRPIDLPKLRFEKGVIHLPEGWEWDPIPRHTFLHIPNTSFNLSTPPPGPKCRKYWYKFALVAMSIQQIANYTV